MRPRTPAPSTATLAPASDPARLKACATTAIGSAKAASSGLTCEASVRAWSCRTTISSAQPPGKWPPYILNCEQRLYSPRWQYLQSPQPRIGRTATSSPTRAASTSAPVSTTVPQTSWPLIEGTTGLGQSPRQVARSEPQLPARSTLSLTSSDRSVADGTSTTAT